jgi:hypothetical protein
MIFIAEPNHQAILKIHAKIHPCKMILQALSYKL